jgi:hypothetical protein
MTEPKLHIATLLPGLRRLKPQSGFFMPYTFNFLANTGFNTSKIFYTIACTINTFAKLCLKTLKSGNIYPKTRFLTAKTINKTVEFMFQTPKSCRNMLSGIFRTVKRFFKCPFFLSNRVSYINICTTFRFIPPLFRSRKAKTCVNVIKYFSRGANSLSNIEAGRFFLLSRIFPTSFFLRNKHFYKMISQFYSFISAKFFMFLWLISTSLHIYRARFHRISLFLVSNWKLSIKRITNLEIRFAIIESKIGYLNFRISHTRDPTFKMGLKFYPQALTS